MKEKHLVRRATKEEQAIDCCGDRWSCYVDYACTCNFKACSGCMENHIFKLHFFEDMSSLRKVLND